MGTARWPSYRGKWVLVNFWASWCVALPGRGARPGGIPASPPGPDFTVLGIDTRDLSGDGRAFVRRYGLSYPQLRDGNGDAGHDYGTTGLPESFLVDPAGWCGCTRSARSTGEYLRSEVESLLPKGKS